MAQFPIPRNERGRLDELRRLALLDTGPSPSFDAITAAAVAALDVPMSLVSLVDEERQWFKSAVGFDGATETPREIAFCGHPVASGKYLEVPDATKDARFDSNPLVQGDAKIRFYAGAPIISPRGNALGTVCVLDTVPRQLTSEQRQLLEHFATMAAALCEEHGHRRKTLGTVDLVLEAIGDAVLATNADGVITFMNPAACRITGWTAFEAIGRQAHEVLPLVNNSGEAIPCPLGHCLATGKADDVPRDALLVTKDGSLTPVEDSVALMVDGACECIGAAMVFRDVSEQRQLQQELIYLAGHDPLTGLFNRLEFERQLDRALSEVHNGHASHALMYLDLDNFKAVNDHFGHAAGDDLLRNVADLIQEVVPPAATVARLGGDEFGVVLHDCRADQALAVANEVVSGVRHLTSQWAAVRADTGVSAGVVSIEASWLASADALTRADAACYAAKRAGGGRVEFFDNSENVIDLAEPDRLDGVVR